MNRFLNTIFLTSLICLLSSSVFATWITGKVTGRDDEPLPFANVYIKGTSTGTTTNMDGFYRLEVPQGHFELVYRYIGYKMHVEPVFISSDPVNIDIKLVSENYALSEVTIRADAEDPAYAVIRNAIKKRKFYKDQVDAFSCDVYIKGLQKITKYPKKLFGLEVNFGQFVDSASGIIYLSESVSQYNFEKPDNVKEIMLSSKVSGSNKAFSFNQASDMQFDFYENIMDVQGLSERGFISPISNNALFYYRYRLEGSFYENGHWVNKIEVIPKRKNDPVFAGYIYIQDSTWRIHSTDLYLTKDAQIEFVDTLRVDEVFIPADNSDDIWQPGSVTFKFSFSAFGFEGNGNYVGVFSSYNLKPEFPKGFFKGTVMKVNEDSNKKDSTYWEKIRPVPLTTEESRDYVKRDSVRVIRESKPYLDSLDRISNKFKFSSIIGGYTYINRYKKTEFSFSSLLQNIQYNTVEGVSIGIAISHSKRYEHRRSLDKGIMVRYGFANEKYNSVGYVQYNYLPKKFGYLRLEGGDDLVQYNSHNPISPIINTSYTLLGEENYMKLYRKSFGKLESRFEPVNGIRLTGGLEFAERGAVVNATDYTFKDYKNRRLTSNNPLLPENDHPAFNTNQAMKFYINGRFRIKQKYIDRPDVNFILGSKYPTVLLSYEKGIKTIGGSDVDYDRIEAGLEDALRLGMIGTFNYDVSYGKFLNHKSLYFMDAAHFNGNKTFFSSFDGRRFDLLDYYTYSTANEYIQAFGEHEFGGFILNKIPLIRKLKLNEIAGVRYLHVPHLDDHYEFSFGLEKLGFIRGDFVMAVDGTGKLKTGFVFGVKGSFGN